MNVLLGAGREGKAGTIREHFNLSGLNSRTRDTNWRKFSCKVRVVDLRERDEGG